jgi:hypothetical protein
LPHSFKNVVRAGNNGEKFVYIIGRVMLAADHKFQTKYHENMPYMLSLVSGE